MKTYISDLVNGAEIVSFFIVNEATVRQAKNGSSYLALKLGDKSGVIDGRMWALGPGFDGSLYRKGCYVKIRADVGEFGTQLQLNIKQLRVAEEFDDGVDIADFFERSERDPEEMFADLFTNYVSEINDISLVWLVDKLLIENKDNFMKAPAAKSKHHAFIGGLLEHSLSLCGAAKALSSHYTFLDRNILYATCVLHDIGKTKELSYSGPTSYTPEGTLLGHIPIGMDMISTAIRSYSTVFPEVLKMKILHMVASHHGLLEWGSPKVPLMREAIVFHLLDMVDSRLGLCAAALKSDKTEGDFTGFLSDLGGPLFKS